MTRSEFPMQVRTAVLTRAAGFCEGCHAPLQRGRYQFDHAVPDGLGGKPTLSNCVVLCSECHGEKTRKQDVPAIAKADRIGKKHRGEKVSRNPMPGSRRSGWRKRMNGTVERR